MSDTRNHTTRDQLADVIAAHSYTYPDSFCSCHAFVTHATYATHLADELLASDVIAAVRAAAVAETTAAIEAWAQATIDALPEEYNVAAHATVVVIRDLRNSALSGGRTALDTTLAQAWDDAWADGMATAAAWMRNEIVPPTPNPYRADTGADQ